MTSNNLRIVTRPDFDGIVCAVLLRDAENIQSDIHWVEPNEIQSGTAKILKGDILANLPYDKNCTFWFDHHISNKPNHSFEGAFEVAPSAARVIYQYYQAMGKLDNRYDELLYHTDIIDAALLNKEQVRFPENYPYILLSMTIKNQNFEDIKYWNHLVDLLKDTPIDDILAVPTVDQRCREVIRENETWEKELRDHTRVENKISITDFRSLEQVPNGNRFLTYSIFPESIASVKIRYGSKTKETVQLSIGQSIFNRQCNVNIGKLLSRYGGGGHAGAGGCTMDSDTADDQLSEILAVLFQNRPIE